MPATLAALATTPPTLAHIQAAHPVVRQHCLWTPLIESPRLNARFGGRLLFKAENLQKTGAFKYRGASYFLSLLDEAACRCGVVAYSSGNHAQAVAAAAAALGIHATIVIPQDAPQVKIRNTREYGADVVLYDPQRESREAIGDEIVQRTGATLIPPYNHPVTIAGQGTVGLEMVEQARALEASLSAVLVPCSGGGLSAGVALAVKGLSPQTEVYTVEPQGFDDVRRSLAAGQRCENAPGATTLCDALMMPTPGDITLPILQANCAGGFAVSDAEVLQAMKVAYEELKLVLEPGGAVAFAAVLSGCLSVTGRTVGIVLSGGNVDEAVFGKLFAS